MKNKKFVKMFTRPFDIQRQEGALRQGAVFGLEEVVIIPSGEPGLFNWYFEEGQMKNVGRRVCEIFFDIKDFEDLEVRFLNNSSNLLSEVNGTQTDAI